VQNGKSNDCHKKETAVSDLKNLMVSISGIRGIVGDGLTPEVVVQLAQAYGSEFGPGRIVVGRDSRVTGNMIKYAVWAGLMSVGCDVLDIGIASTPTTEMITEQKENSGGIIITASHNPREWNALKLLAPDGLFLSPDAGEKIISKMKSRDFAFAPWDKIGQVVAYEHAAKDHIDAVLALDVINQAAIRRNRFKIVVDCVNGAGGTILSQLLEILGCDAVFINQEPHGRFPRNPEPVPGNLRELCDAVQSHQADIGFAVDPDVDRLAIVSEKGIPLGEEYTLALVTDFLLAKNPGKVVVNASTTRAIDDIANKHGGQVFRTRVGEIHVSLKARQIGAVICGEGNGGVIYPKLHLGRDAVVGMALVLQHLAESGKSISKLKEALPQYSMVKDKLSLPFDANAREIVQCLIRAHAGETIDTIDGAKFLYKDSWVHIRASNTEPIIRIIAEAPEEEEAGELVELFKKEIASYS
jgi:phosphomannomutase